MEDKRVKDSNAKREQKDKAYCGLANCGCFVEEEDGNIWDSGGSEADPR